MLIDIYRSKYYKNAQFVSTITVGEFDYDIYLIKPASSARQENNTYEYGIYSATKKKDITKTSGLKALITTAYYPATKSFYVNNFEVLPSCQTKGLGSAILEWVKQTAADLGAEKMELISVKALVPVYKKVDQQSYVLDYKLDRNAYVYYCHANMELDEVGIKAMVEDDIEEGLDYSCLVFKYNLKSPTKPMLKGYASMLKDKRDFNDKNIQQIIQSIVKKR